MVIIMKGKFIVLSGPSGVGKGSICSKLVKDINAWYSVSATTRGQRDGEINGVDYFFISKDEFLEKISRGELLEYNVYNGNYYGTLRETVLDKINNGIDVLTEVDVNGARKLKEIFPNCVLIYILPPSYGELYNRLINRNTESEDVIQNRIEIAKEEIKSLYIYDYIVVNDDLDDAVNKIKKYIAI